VANTALIGHNFKQKKDTSLNDFLISIENLNLGTRFQGLKYSKNKTRTIVKIQNLKQKN